jgi:uncharacterized protein
MADKMDPVVHFEMPYEDAKRVSSFYSKAFGWQMSPQGEKFGDYILATTTEVDPKTVRPKNPGAVNGGLFPKKTDWPTQYPPVVIAVDDIKAAMKKVAAAGGKVLGEPVEIPGTGMYVSFTDTEGNRASMLQPSPM